MRPGSEIVFATFGSLGDIHPYLAIARRLKQRGARPVIATSADHEEAVRQSRLEFRAIRPNLGALYYDGGEPTDLFRRSWSAREGSEVLIREIYMKHIRDSFDDLRCAVESADLLVTHPVTYAGPTVAEVSGVPWVSTVLSPLSLLSASDPCVLPTPLGAIRAGWLPPAILRMLYGAGKLMYRGWTRPLRRLRADLGLAPAVDPLFSGAHSPTRVLVMVSSIVAPPQPDWPAAARSTGFVFHDEDAKAASFPDRLLRFLEAGPPPIAFTLGSSNVAFPGRFYRESAEAARRLGRRAVLLVGRGAAAGSESRDGELRLPYAPYGPLFRRAAVVVHQGGIGTCAKALRSGRPMLVVPSAHDQLDNAERMKRLGVARVVPRNRYGGRRVDRALRALLEDRAHAGAARAAAGRIAAEPGIESVCDELERAAAARRHPPTRAS